jgi:Polyketide cyclase / dehydrase and lipid transport
MMPTFSLREQDLAWVDRAPIVITKSFPLAAPTPDVWNRLADISTWSEWCGGMRRVRIDGAATGVGALRTVWVGTTRVQERFVVWDPGQRLTFTLTGSNTPGLRSMVEDWATAPDPMDPTRTVLTVRVGIEAAGILRPFPGLVRAIMSGPLKGAAGITTQFPPTGP